MLIETAQKIIEELRQDLYKRTGHMVPEIKVYCNNTLKRCWGLAIGDGDSLTIKLNKKIFEGKHDSYVFYKIVVHEFCHIADYVISGDMHDHGTEWQQLMYSFGQYPYAKVVEQDMNGVGIEPKYYHACGCAKHRVSTALHNLIVSGKLYRCKKCKISIKQEYEVGC